MNMIFTLARRNIKLFLKDRVTLMFTFMAPFLVLMLSLVFLRRVQIDGLMENLKGLPIPVDWIANLVDGWSIAGILAVSCLTVALNSSMTRVSDADRHIADDFRAAPVRSWQIDLAYWISSFVLSVTLCGLILAVGFVYLATQGTRYGIVGILKGAGILLLSCLSATSFMTFLFRFFKTPQACGAFSGIVSALSGFATGAYIPLSQFSVGMQSVLSILPASHSASLFRQLLLVQPLSNFPPMVAEQLRGEYNLDLHFLGTLAKTPTQLLWLSGSIAVFFALNVAVYHIKRRASKL